MVLQKWPNCHGFSLVEVLVSILILTIGMVGVATLQLNALRTAQQSAFRTNAVQLASEMADVMRIHHVSDIFSQISYSALPGKDPVAPAALCYTKNCNAEDLTKFQIYEWERHIQTLLPGARALVCRDAHPWSETTGAFGWECDNSVTAAPLVIKLGWLGKGDNPDGSVARGDAQSFPPSIAMVVASYKP